MGSLHVEATVVGADAPVLFTRLRQLDWLPSLTGALRRLDVTPIDHATFLSDWEIEYGTVALRWREVDQIDRDRMAVSFRCLAGGDFVALAGEWQVRPDAGGCVVAFDAEWDAGQHGMEELLDAIAEGARIDNLERVLHELGGQRRLHAVRDDDGSER